MMILPFHVDVPMERWPVTNILLIVATCFVFALLRLGTFAPEQVLPYVLGTGHPEGLIGHIFIHFTWMHLIGNMVFLWTFGNAVCAKIGNFSYLGLYLLLGILAGLAHFFIDGRPAIGASGAVNGVVGMFLIFYPRNNVTCLFWFIFIVRTFYLSSIWMILFWLAFDVYGALQVARGASELGGVAYFAHLGGFAGGFLAASWLLRAGIVRMRPTEESLYAWLRD